MAKLIIFFGVLFIIVGVIYHFYGNVFSWFGNLPGDISLKRENFSLQIPLVSMVLVSIVLNFLLWLFRHFSS